MIIVIREGGRRCRFPTPRRALAGLMCLCRHDTLAPLAAGAGLWVGIVDACTTAVIDLLADRVPGRRRALREAEPDYIVCDGSGGVRPGGGLLSWTLLVGGNVQVVTDPVGRAGGCCVARMHNLALAA
ncbi:hypothetical protein [Streptomyces sp. 1222.5]|uniref:hypothetical protein n=1 Tax=Streptomyces sp. 1222.5 TaxID=1881026 RepID=UPI003EB99207